MENEILTFALLLGLELVLGVDNILIISIMVGGVPEENRGKARFFGLAFALVARLIVLFIFIALSQLTEVKFLGFSVRDYLLLGGGTFLLWKAIKEIHHTVEVPTGEEDSHVKPKATFMTAVASIAMMDLVFSVDSVITAIGLTNHTMTIIAAVIVSFGVILWFAKPVGDFILKTPSLKILVLSFLVTIGITLILEGMGKHVPKGYIYLPMGFAMVIEFLQLRYDHNRKIKASKK